MVHFWEFEFVFVEVIPPLGHAVVDADIIEEDDSARADEWTVERQFDDDLLGVVVDVAEKDVDGAALADLPCEGGVGACCHRFYTSTKWLANI